MRYEEPTPQRAIDTGVFGAPTYVVEGELFWGQDRLDFLERRLASGRLSDRPAARRGHGASRPLPAYLPYLALASAMQALFGSPDMASHFSAATL